MLSLENVVDYYKVFCSPTYHREYKLELLIDLNRYPNLMQVTATLTLAAACSSAGVVVLFVRDVHFCKKYPQLSCGMYQISIAMAFITWLLVAKSSLVMFWILASG